MDATDTHYDRLAVSRDAPPEVIRAAYKALSQKFHPDRNPGDSEAERVMTLLNQSYEVLMDPLRRAEYDGWIDARENGSDASPPTDDPDQGDVQPPQRSAVDVLCKKIGIKTALLLAFGAVFVISALVGGFLAKAQEERGAMEARWAAAHVQQRRAAALASARVPDASLPRGKTAALEKPSAEKPAARAEPTARAEPALPTSRTARLETDAAPASRAGPATGGADSSSDLASPVSRDEARQDVADSKLTFLSARPDLAADRPPRKEKSGGCTEASGGDAFPKESYSGYLPGQAVMNADGRSTFTVDNMQVDEDVLVKLVDVDNRALVRSFQVRANSSFTAEQLGHGKYKVLYRPRKSSCAWHAVGGVFDVREEEVEGDVRPANVKITLHGTDEVAPAELERY